MAYRLLNRSRFYQYRSLTTVSTSLAKQTIPKLNESVTRIGFGGYRLNQPKTHADTLKYALQQGINIIDTGANFENGLSESIIGNVLSTTTIPRSDITLVTKAGYLSKADIERYQQHNDVIEGKDYIHIQGNSYHGISPNILNDQLEQSLNRLKTNYIDIFMINAPERMLTKNNMSSNQLYTELKSSFQFLKEMVKQGVIKGYGLCSNTLTTKESIDYISLSSFISQLQNQVGGDDLMKDFVALQTPFNLYEQHILHDTVVMDLIEQHDLFLMTNRPLNAITPQGQIRGLYNHQPLLPMKDMEDLSNAFEKVTQLEMDMITELPSSINNDDDLEDEVNPFTSSFIWGQVLSENLQRLGQHHFATRHYLETQVKPKLEKDLNQFRQQYHDVQAYMDWVDIYHDAMLHLLNCLVNYSYMDTLKKNNDMEKILSVLVPWSHQHQYHQDRPSSSSSSSSSSISYCHSPLTVKALEIYLANKEIGSIMTGMRHPLYVDDAVLAMKEHQQSPLSQLQLMDISKVLV
ncbi:unnamed protein product [Cunninghamella blakesleeana]